MADNFSDIYKTQTDIRLFLVLVAFLHLFQFDTLGLFCVNRRLYLFESHRVSNTFSSLRESAKMPTDV